MGLFDAINISEGGMSVHSYRSQVAAENIANMYTKGYHRKVVDLAAHNFGASLDQARTKAENGDSKGIAAMSSGGMDATDGAVRVTGTHAVSAGPGGERQEALLDTSDLLSAKSAYELNVRAATLLKGMATAALEIGRGS